MTVNELTARLEKVVSILGIENFNEEKALETIENNFPKEECQLIMATYVGLLAGLQLGREKVVNELFQKSYRSNSSILKK